MRGAFGIMICCFTVFVTFLLCLVISLLKHAQSAETKPLLFTYRLPPFSLSPSSPCSAVCAKKKKYALCAGYVKSYYKVPKCLSKEVRGPGKWSRVKHNNFRARATKKLFVSFSSPAPQILVPHVILQAGGQIGGWIHAVKLKLW
jgi:hypothetical protein